MNKFTVFKIAEDDFGFSIERVVEILKVQKVFSIPGLPEFLSGVISVRGSIIPLMDLRTRFGVTPAGPKERIIIARFENEKIGFLVDEIKEILTLADEEVIKPPSLFKGFSTEYLTGLGKKDDRIIILLNIDNLLTSEEKIQLRATREYIEEQGAGVGKTTE